MCQAKTNNVLHFKKRKMGEFYWTKLPDMAKGTEATEQLFASQTLGKLQHKNVKNIIS